MSPYLSMQQSHSYEQTSSHARRILLTLPVTATLVSSLSLVRYRNYDYSVPTRHGHQELLAKRYVDRVAIPCHGEIIATHGRNYDKADFVYNPLHYLRRTQGLATGIALTSCEVHDVATNPEERSRHVEVQCLRKCRRYAVGHIHDCHFASLERAASPF